MKVRHEAIDSEALGGPVLSVVDFDPKVEFLEFERQYRTDWNPRYVGCKVPLDSLEAIHILEGAGFNFVECQIRSTLSFRKPFPCDGHPYRFERVESESELAPVLAIAGETFTHDRFSNDNGLAPGVSADRYRRYVMKSFQDPDERVFRLVENSTGVVVAFKTHKVLANGEILFLLGGVRPDLKDSGLGALNNYFEFNELKKQGFKKGTTHISAANTAVFNLEIGRMGFRVVGAFAVMRKLYF